MRNETNSILINALFGFAVCIIIGLLMYGFAIFDIKDSRSQLFSLGLYGAIFYSVLKYGKLKETVFIGLIIFIGNMLLQGKTQTLSFIIRDVFFFSSLFGALVLYKMFIGNFSNFPLFVRGFALSIFLGLLNIIATLILILIFNPSSFEINTAIFLNAQYASLIGLGLGIGFDLYEKYQDKIFAKSGSNVA